MNLASVSHLRLPSFGLLFGLCLLLSGCGGSVTQLETSEAVRYWAVLRTACSAQDAEMLGKARESIEAAQTKGEITDNELAQFQKILQTAEEGRWAEAEKMCHRLHAVRL